MALLLMAACLGLLVLVVTALGFWAAARTEEEPLPLQTEVAQTASPPGFFADSAAPARAMRTQVPIEALLLQIESHVRLEQAAAESFLEYPTAALLHSRTISPLVN